MYLERVDDICLSLLEDGRTVYGGLKTQPLPRDEMNACIVQHKSEAHTEQMIGCIVEYAIKGPFVETKIAAQS